jgi:hypothetical protein
MSFYYMTAGDTRPKNITFMKIIHSILIVCVCLFVLPGKSFADPERATVLVRNPTGKQIHYEVKWGSDGQWKGFVLNAGRATTHWKRYISTGVPPPYIKFEAFSTFDGGAGRKYKLGIGWDNNPRQYHFEVKDNTVYFFED